MRESFECYLIIDVILSKNDHQIQKISFSLNMSLSIFLLFVGTSSSSFSTLFFTTGLEGGVRFLKQAVVSFSAFNA